jgi:tripartite ATP-independent transporter DctP family solute receptor
MQRRQFATSAAAALAGIAIIKSPARAAQFSYKYGNDQTEISPLTKRARQMWDAIERETGGKLHVDTYPNSVLGGDSQMITQIRTGALQFLTEPGVILQSVVPAAAIDSVGFAFKESKQAFAAMDGELGDFVIKEIATKGLVCIPHAFDNGMRQITANKPVRVAGDIDGVKIRVPTSALFVDMFKALGASPTPLNVSELYAALSTHVVDAEENALINIEQSKFYEVQKTLNFSNHAWSCWWMLANKDAWDALGTEIQSVVVRNVSKYAALQRSDFAALTTELIGKLKEQGMQQLTCDVPTFKAKLGGYYAKWKGEFGPTAWNLLEKYAGTLA